DWWSEHDRDLLSAVRSGERLEKSLRQVFAFGQGLGWTTQRTDTGSVNFETRVREKPHYSGTLMLSFSYPTEKLDGDLLVLASSPPDLALVATGKSVSRTSVASTRARLSTDVLSIDQPAAAMAWQGLRAGIIDVSGTIHFVDPSVTPLIESDT